MALAWKHRLSNIDLDEMVADCEYCGLGVPIVSRDRIRCWLGRQKGGTYGDIRLTREEKMDRFDEQEPVCPICFKSITYEVAALDHDHNTGQIRSFLCGSCNLGLGQFGDNPDTLKQAAEYIKLWREKNAG